MNGDSKTGECLVALFLLGAVLFNPLIIGIFDVGAGALFFGIPVLYLYLFAAWAVLIGLLAMVIESAGGMRNEPPATTEIPLSAPPET